MNLHLLRFSKLCSMTLIEVEVEVHDNVFHLTKTLLSLYSILRAIVLAWYFLHTLSLRPFNWFSFLHPLIDTGVRLRVMHISNKAKYSHLSLVSWRIRRVSHNHRTQSNYQGFSNIAPLQSYTRSRQRCSMFN